MRQKTCLAFAGAVFQDQRQLQECPQSPQDLVEQLNGAIETHPPFEPGLKYLEQLKSEVSHIDFAAAAQRAGGTFSGDKLTLKVLGKDFNVDTQGRLSAAIHINPWIAVPLLNYILYGEGLPVARQMGFPAGTA